MGIWNYHFKTRQWMRKKSDFLAQFLANGGLSRNLQKIMERGMKFLTSTLLIGSAAVLTLSACGAKPETATETVVETVAEIAPMDAVLAGEWRSEQAARDVFRHPKETLAFFGLEPGQMVLEIFPGGGWYTNDLAPYSAKTGGTYIAASFESSLGDRYAASNARFMEKFADVELYGSIQQRELGPTSASLGTGDVDLVLSFRNVHSWMRSNYADKAFAEFYAALKPGGILGIVEHRLPESMEQDPKAGTGYVQVSYTKALAAEAGFEFVEASEINANSNDTADHPFGVWTLPPSSRSPKEGEEGAADFDAAKYLAIGESDRYTLKFRKPIQ
jgi:predicted methyltransferase